MQANGAARDCRGTAVLRGLPRLDRAPPCAGGAGVSVNTSIAWCDHTFNPWHGCARVSPGCENCYAEAQGKRFGTQWGTKADRRFFGEKHWQEPLKWNVTAANVGERRRVFCASMADVFEDRRDLDEPRARLWRLIEATPHLDWLLLTKRPENADKLAAGAAADCFGDGEAMPPVWPRNVWLGTTVEDQRRADERIPHLLRVPAAVRFLSCEPLLQPVDLTPYLVDDLHRIGRAPRMEIDWVIVGGESGPGARTFRLAWARSIVKQCRAAGTAVFVKQMGSHPVGVQFDGEGFDGIQVVTLLDRKGGDPSEWPEDLRVREFPVQS
jgi:protein gp37